MKFILTYTLILVCLSVGYTQRPDADIVETSQGDLKIQPVIHGTLVLEWEGKTIYVDPYGGAKAFSGLNDPDIILITDIHGDHLNQNTLDELNTSKARFVVPKAVYDDLPSEMQNRAEVVNNGGTVEIAGIPIIALPMYNLPESPDSRHTKGRGNGYVLSLGGKQVYISGDTEDVPEMRALRGVDVAFVCMNLPYTMSVDQAADAVLEFKPKVVYPFHYRGKEGLADTEKFKELVSANESVEVRLRNWYPEY